MIGIFALLALVSALLAVYSSEDIDGRAHVIDGDSLKIQGREIRLVGIDAPEFRQLCLKGKASPQKYECGRMAAQHLKSLVSFRDVGCSGSGDDKYRRLLAICTVEGTDINREMVLSGWAVSSGDYEVEEAAAEEGARGVWQGEFENPAQWRRSRLEEKSGGWLSRVFGW